MFKFSHLIKLIPGYRCGALLSLVLCVLLMAGCIDWTTGLQIAIDSSTPFVQSLVQTGKITQAQADKAVGSLRDSAKSIGRGIDCAKAITLTGKAKTIAKAQCYLTTATELRAILARNDLLGVHPELDRIAIIVQGAITALEDYFNAVNGTGTAAAVTNGAPTDPEKQLKHAIEELTKQTKALSKQ